MAISNIPNDLHAHLAGSMRNGPIPVAFPHSTDVILSTINSSATDEIDSIFKEYFKFDKHQVVPSLKFADLVDPTFAALLGGRAAVGRPQTVEEVPPNWPPDECLPSYHVTIKGKRHIIDGKLFLYRLFLADLLWLFYMERMGMFRILGAVLDDFATKGKYRLSGRNQQAMVLEAMVREMKTGEASTVRDRDSAYRRSLGWTSEAGRKAGSEAVVNMAFNTLFHKFLQTALVYYREKRLVTAIGIAAAPGTTVSVATVVDIKDTIILMKQAFEPFTYGRNYSITLNGIVWAIAGLALLREVYDSLGIPIPKTTAAPDQYVPAAYDLLLLGRPITSSDVNRYRVHRDIATYGRALLLDIQALIELGADETDVKKWLDDLTTEGRIEGYRSAYRSLTGVDLGAPGTPTIEQQA
jgi:hypothetical protein